MSFTLSSSAFKDGGPIPAKYTCDGADASPPLNWSEPPEGTRAFALIMDDPDAPSGVFTHWIIINLPAETRQIPEAATGDRQLPAGAVLGRTDFRKAVYGGPCPPRGPAHRYRFTLHALDKPLELRTGSTKKQLLEAMRGHITGEAQLIGTYRR